MNMQMYWTKFASECERIGFDPTALLVQLGFVTPDGEKVAADVPELTDQIAYLHGFVLKCAEHGVDPNMLAEQMAFAKKAFAPLPFLGGLGVLPGMISGTASAMKGKAFSSGFKQPYAQLGAGLRKFWSGTPYDYAKKPLNEAQFKALNPAEQRRYASGWGDFQAQQTTTNDLWKSMQPQTQQAAAPAQAAVPPPAASGGTPWFGNIGTPSSLDRNSGIANPLSPYGSALNTQRELGGQRPSDQRTLPFAI